MFHELDDNAIVGVKMILRALGEDPDRDGLKDTPKRYQSPEGNDDRLSRRP
jgi:GTP cyclohydrolase I